MSAEKGTNANELKQPGLTRGQRLLNQLMANRDHSQISLWRARLLTASWKETGGVPTPLRRAKAFEKIVTQIPTYIEEDQLLVGDFAAKPVCGERYAEFSMSSIK